MTGISMGGYGTLKIAFKHPERFLAIAPMEPVIEPSLKRLPDGKRNTQYAIRNTQYLVPNPGGRTTEIGDFTKENSK